MIKFTIPLAPISKKNSQQIVVNPQTKRPFIMPSKKYKEYEKAALWHIPKNIYIDAPVNVKCLFYMPTHRKCDLTNLLEAIDDVLVKAGLLADDNYTVVESHDGSRVLYDKENPRTEVYIETSESLFKGKTSKYIVYDGTRLYLGGAELQQIFNCESAEDIKYLLKELIDG